MTLRDLRGVLLFGWLCACTLLPLSTQAQSASQDRATSFEAVTGPAKEDVAGGPLLLAAYAIVWLVVFGYVFHLVRLHRGVEDNLTRVERAVGAARK
jgi:CcmD family protein